MLSAISVYGSSLQEKPNDKKSCTQNQFLSGRPHGGGNIMNWPAIEPLRDADVFPPPPGAQL